MSNTSQLETIKSQTLERLVEITAAPKPTYNVDGQSVSWSEYRESLQRTIDWCNQQLSTEEPFEIDSTAIT